MSKVMTMLFYTLAVAIGVLAVLTVLMPFSHLISTDSAYSRCSARGFDDHEVIVRYPFFWDVTITCYGEGRADGVEL